MFDYQTLWDYENPEESERRFRAAMDSDPSLRPLLLTQIARAQGLRGKFEEARETLKEADAQMAEGDSRERTLLHLELGRVENSSGNKKASVPHFKSAYDIATRIDDHGLAVDAAHMLGIVEESNAAFEWNQVALDIATKSDQPDARRWRASLLNNIGWAYHDIGDFEKALLLFQEAVPLREQMGNSKTLLIARWCVARCLRSMNRHEEALRILRELEGPDATGYVYEELAENLLVAEDPSAKQYFAKAYAILKEDDWLSSSDPKRIERIRTLANA